MQEELHTKLKAVSALQGMTIQGYIEQEIKNHVKKDLRLVRELLE